MAEPSTVPYATVFQHLNALASEAAAGRDRPHASLVHRVIEVTVARLRNRVCDGRCAQAAARQAQRR